MSISQWNLAQLWLCAFLLGVLFALIYNGLRAGRVLFGAPYHSSVCCCLQAVKLPLLKASPTKHRRKLWKVLSFFGDILFCVSIAVAMIFLFYQLNNGKVRLPAFVCLAVGFFLCHHTLAKLVGVGMELFWFALTVLFRYISFFLCLPIRLLIDGLRRVAAFGRKKILLQWHSSRRKRCTARAWQNLQDNACGMTFGNSSLRKETDVKEKFDGKEEQKAV